jgi:hypothetical protein
MHNISNEILNSPTWMISTNKDGTKKKFTTNRMKNKHLLIDNSLISKEKKRFMESHYEDFDKIYNDIFCTVKNLRDGKIFLYNFSHFSNFFNSRFFDVFLLNFIQKFLIIVKFRFTIFY